MAFAWSPKTLEPEAAGFDVLIFLIDKGDFCLRQIYIPG